MESHHASFRHQVILELLASHGQVLVQHLAERFDVTQETIRRDLNKLEALQLLKKVHGGAVNLQSKFEQNFSERSKIALDEKRAIAQKAASFIQPGDTLFIDFGTTTQEFAKQVKNVNQLTIITNSPLLAEVLQENPTIDVILIGGQFTSTRYACLGAIALNNVSRLFADYAVIGAGAIDPSRGVMDQDIDEAAMAQKMIENSQKVMILADSSKLNKQAIAHVCHWKQVNIMITNGDNNAELDEINHQGVTVVVAGNTGKPDSISMDNTHQDPV